MDVFLTLLVALGIFLLCRDIWCWFFKISRIVSLLEKIERHLEGGTKTDA